MAGIDWLAIAALVISALVALSNISKEWRERRSIGNKERLDRQKAHEDNAMLPIRGANEAVVALQNALKITNENEDKLRTRIANLEKESQMKDELIDQLEHRLWYCERELKTLKGETTNG